MKIVKTLGIATLLLSSASFANNNSNYFYLSANAGLFQADFSHVYRDQTDVIRQSIAESVIQHGYTIGAAAGFRQLFCQNYFYGGELSIHAENHKASFQSGAATAAFSDNTRIRYHSDLVFVPGLQLTDFVSGYIKLGLSYALIRDELSSPTGFIITMTDYNSHENAFGFAAGLGVSKSISDNFSVFAETNYHDYGIVDFQDFQNFSANYSHSSHVYSYDLSVGLSYNFCT